VVGGRRDLTFKKMKGSGSTMASDRRVARQKGNRPLL